MLSKWIQIKTLKTIIFCCHVIEKMSMLLKIRYCPTIIFHTAAIQHLRKKNLYFGSSSHGRKTTRLLERCVPVHSNPGRCKTKMFLTLCPRFVMMRYIWMKPRIDSRWIHGWPDIEMAYKICTIFELSLVICWNLEKGYHI